MTTEHSTTEHSPDDIAHWKDPYVPGEPAPTHPVGPMRPRSWSRSAMRVAALAGLAIGALPIMPCSFILSSTD
jgi:hypothetical protein